MLPEEAVIRSLGETAERYSQFLAGVSRRRDIIRRSWKNLVGAGEPVLERRLMEFFSSAQFDNPGFPFRPFAPDCEMGWIKMPSLLPGGGPVWVPAQLVLVGYVVRDTEGEPWLSTAVTTGSAAHVNHLLALRNSLLELIQIDAAMGHWHSGAMAPRIELDSRTTRVERLIATQFSRQGPRPSFYWLESADLGCKIVACVIRDPEAIPRVGVGLGADLDLEHAMYKSMLEAVGVMQLAKVTLLDRATEERGAIDAEQIYDLDSNVAWYALPRNAAKIDTRFSDARVVKASQLPGDGPTDALGQVRSLVARFAETGKQLFVLDLTTRDIRKLGMVAVRVWSPNTAGLCFPSAPQARHVRYPAYGGFRDSGPHPYP
ncbi:MAG TPA: YcaO-like family protein [Sorangium sp.]|nr:YcaO-like family protein [Sorangium sp.]